MSTETFRLMLRTTSERTDRASADARLREGKRKRSPRRASDPFLVLCSSDVRVCAGYRRRREAGAARPAVGDLDPGLDSFARSALGVVSGLRWRACSQQPHGRTIEVAGRSVGRMMDPRRKPRLGDHQWEPWS